MKTKKVSKQLIKEQVGRMTGREFARNVKSKASLHNVDVIAALDTRKINDFGRLASREQRLTLGDSMKRGSTTVKNLLKQVAILRKIQTDTKAKAEDKIKAKAEADKLRTIMAQILANSDLH